MRQTDVVELEPMLRRITAPNPSPMTGGGTQTYLIGRKEVAVVDPGPLVPAHLEAIMAAVSGGGRLAHILVTHAHRDHSAAAAALAQMSGARVYGFGPAGSGRSEAMIRLRAGGLLAGGEGVDHGFAPDICLADGAVLGSAEWQITAHHTPGHYCNHLSFQLGDVVLTGDVVMGWTSTLISPPDGDLGQYYASLARLEGVGARVFYPGHGAPVRDPAQRITHLRAHRETRHAQITALLERGPASARGLAAEVYGALPPALLPAATRNTLAHLIDMAEKTRVEVEEPISEESFFRLL